MTSLPLPEKNRLFFESIVTKAEWETASRDPMILFPTVIEAVT